MPTSVDFAALRSNLLARLGRFRAQLRRHLALEGLARWIVEFVGICLASFIVDRLLRLSLPMRLIIGICAAGFLLYELWRWILRPLMARFSLIGLVAAIDRIDAERPALASRVATVLELPNLLQSHAAPSATLVQAAVQRCHDDLSAIDFQAHLNRQRRNMSYWILVGCLVVALALAGIFPHATGLWFKRYFLASNQPWPQKTYLLVEGVTEGKLVVPRAEPFTLRVMTRSGSVDPQLVNVRYREHGANRLSASMSHYGPGDWRYDFPPLGETTDVEVAGNDDLQYFTVEPIERPRLTDLLLVSQHPTEAQPTPHHFGGQDSDLAFLPKTKLDLTFTANVAIAEARIKSNVATPGQAALKRINDHQFSLSWTQEAAVQLQIELVGAAAHLASLPVPVAVGLKQDLPPRVNLSFSGVKQRITPMATIPLAIQARDDYGVARLDLITESQILTTDSTTQPATSKPAKTSSTQTLLGPVKPPTDLEVQRSQRMDVSGFGLLPGSLLTIHATAMDDCYTGAQTGVSRPLTFHIVPPEELFREILLREQSERVKFRKELDAAQKVHDNLTGGVTTTVAADHRAIQREVLRITTSLDESVTELKLNQLGGKEAWNLIDTKVLAPLKKLNEDTMNQQKDALDSLNPKDAKQMEAAGAREQLIVDQMQEILRQMAQWDSFVDVVNQLNEVIKLETGVHQSTDQMKKKQEEGVFEK